jgi:hypothetical protein
MRLQTSAAGWHLTLPAWSWLTRVIIKLAYRTNPMPELSISDAHTHVRHSWYMVIDTGLKLDNSILASKNPKAATIHVIKPHTPHQWLSLGKEATVVDLHQHQAHTFSPV